MTAEAYYCAEEAPMAEGEGVTRPQATDERRRTHKERFRASLAWALDEYASTLEKLSK